MGKANCSTCSATNTCKVLVCAILLFCTNCAGQTFSATVQVVDFGDVAFNGVSDTHTITLVNNGDAAVLAAASIQARTGSAEDQFTIIGGTCTTLTGQLQTTGTCTYTVQAKPTVLGAVSGILTVTGNNVVDGLFASQPVTLTANSLYGMLAMLPDLQFGDVPVGTTSSPLDTTLVNIGKVPAILSGAKLTVHLPNSGQYAVTGGTCFAYNFLPPGAACILTIVANPAAAGQVAGRLMLQGGAGSAYAPVSIALTVNGISSTLPSSPALNPGQASSSSKPSSNPPPPPPHHYHHSGK